MEAAPHPATAANSGSCKDGGGVGVGGDGTGTGEEGTAGSAARSRARKEAGPEGGASRSPLLTVTMEDGAAEEAPRAVWLGRVAAVMEARGDRDEAVRLYGEASAELTGGERNGSVGALAGSGKASGNGRAGCIGRGGAAGAAETARREEGDSGDGSGGGMRALFPYSARAHHLASMIERCYRRHFLR